LSRSSQAFGRPINCRSFSCGPGPLVCHEQNQGTGTGSLSLMADFGCPSLLQGSRPWNSLIEYSRVLTAAQSSSSLRASRYSSTTNNSRTTPSAANSARRNGCVEARRCAPKPAQPAQSAEPKPPSPSSPHREDRCSAEAVSKSRERTLPSPNPPASWSPIQARG
jgi:hypothetical protein